MWYISCFPSNPVTEQIQVLLAPVPAVVHFWTSCRIIGATPAWTRFSGRLSNHCWLETLPSKTPSNSERETLGLLGIVLPQFNCFDIMLLTLSQLLSNHHMDFRKRSSKVIFKEILYLAMIDTHSGYNKNHCSDMCWGVEGSDWTFL